MNPRVQQDPAEGSRETVERELKRESHQPPVARGKGDRKVTRDDVARMLRRDDDLLISQILAQQPSISELEQAVVWSRGEGDVADVAGQPLSGKVAKIYELIAASEPEED